MTTLDTRYTLGSRELTLTEERLFLQLLVIIRAQENVDIRIQRGARSEPFKVADTRHLVV